MDKILYILSGLDKDPKFISDSMSAVTPPEKAAESAVLVSGGFDPCQYQAVPSWHLKLLQKLSRNLEILPAVVATVQLFD